MEYLEECYAPSRINLSEKSQEQMRRAMRRLEEMLGRPVTLEELSEDFITMAMKVMLSKGISPGQVNIRRGYLISLWRHAYRRKLLTESPFECEVQKLKEPKRKPVAWSLADIGKMLEAAKTHTPRRERWFTGTHWTAWILLLYNTGLRMQASLLLKVTDLKGDLLTVPADIQKDKEELVFRLPPELAKMLHDLHRPDRVCHGRQMAEMLIPLPWAIQNAQRALWVNILEPAGLPDDPRLKFHAFRKTCGTMVAAYGSNHQAMQVLGHSSMSVTQRYLADAHLVDPRIDTDISPMKVIPPIQPQATETRLRRNSTAPKDWDFTGKSVQFRGVKLRLYSEGHRGWVLAALAMSPDPVPIESLVPLITTDSGHTRKLITVHTSLAKIRFVIRQALALPEGHDPVPLTATADGQSGVTLDIPKS